MSAIRKSRAADDRGALLHALIRAQMQPGQMLFAVADAARAGRLVFDSALDFGWRLQWIFPDDAHPHMRDVAPYLFRIAFEQSYPSVESRFLDEWGRQLDRDIGLLLLSNASLEDLWAHLRTLFEVVDDEGNEYFFRFYDPRVLRSFLPACGKQEAAEFFGPIAKLFVGVGSSETIHTCSLGPDGVAIEPTALSQASEKETRGVPC